MPSPQPSRWLDFLVGGLATALLLALVVYLLFFRFDVPWY